MARRQGRRGLCLLMWYIAVGNFPRCPLAASLINELQNQNATEPVKGVSQTHDLPGTNDHLRESLSSHLSSNDTAKSFLQGRRHASRKSLIKTRHGIFSPHVRATLLPVPGHTGPANASTQDSDVSPIKHPSAPPQSHARDHADAPVAPSTVTRSIPRSQAIPTDPDVYDFIVIGCGATGCPLASYLALRGEGRRVLVLERGLERTFEQAPRAMTIYSDGMAIGDEAISQPFATRKGIRTHIAAVMGGGTAIDLAIYIEETKEYFDFLNKRFPAYKFQWPAIQQAYRYVRKVVTRKMPQDTRFGHAFARSLQARGFEPVGGTQPPGYSKSVAVNKQWGTFSLFDVPQGGYRRAADVFLTELPPWARKNVNVRTRHTVERIEFDETHQPPRAKCVLYRPTSYADVKPQGVNFGQTLPATHAGWGPWIGTFLAPQTVLVGPHAPDSPHRFFSHSRPMRRVCINDNPGSEIIISAGAINTAVLLYKSGIGPRKQLEEIGARIIVENPHVGQSFSDRVFIPVSAFMANYADEIMPVSPRPIRRMAPVGDIRRRAKRTSADEAHSILHGASIKSSATGNTTFLGSVQRADAGVAARETLAFRAHRRAEIPQWKDKRLKNMQHFGSRASRRGDLHYRRTFLSARGSAPFATLSRGISEEATVSFAVGTIKGPSDGTSPDFPSPATPVEDFVSPDENALGQENNPYRVVLTDFKNSLSPEITGRFVDVRYPQEGLLSPPRVCQAMGLKQAGPPQGCSAERYSIGKRTLTCSLVVAEETSGGRNQEGVVLASRFVFPPALRNDPLVDVIFEILGACGDYKAPYGLPVFQPLCAIVMPIIKCFRKALATFHFVAEPKSRGSVHLRSDGAVEVEGNYLQDEQDLFDAVRGLSGLIESMNGDTYRGILQPAGSSACPATILNCLLDLILTIASTTSLFSTRKGNFALIQNYLQDLLPQQHRRLRRIIPLEKEVTPRKLVATAVEENGEQGTYYQEGETEPNKFILDDYADSVINDVDEQKLESLGYKGKLEKIGFDFKSFRRHLEARSQPKNASRKKPSQWFAARRVLQKMRSTTEPDSAAQRKMQHSEPAERLPESKALFTEQQLKEAEEACRKPCSTTSGQGSCAAADICCAAFGNSLCISTPENEALERKLQEELSRVLQQQATDPSNHKDIEGEASPSTREATNASEPCDSGDKTCVLRDVYRGGFVSSAMDRMWGVMERLPAAGAAFLKSFIPGSTSTDPSGEIFVDPDLDYPNADTPQDTMPGSVQWAATFPPRLPDPYNPQEMAKYVLTYMSSVWHHCSTAPTGLVVNSDFEVMGTQRLSVVDASVLNQITRLNPVSTLLMLGIYTAAKKLQRLGVADAMPSTNPPATVAVEGITSLHEEEATLNF